MDPFGAGAGYITELNSIVYLITLLKYNIM